MPLGLEEEEIYIVRRVFSNGRVAESNCKRVEEIRESSM